MRPRWFLSSVLAVLGGGPTLAREYGQQGAVFTVIEPDLLRTIEARLNQLDRSGAIGRMNQEFARRSEEKVRRPEPVAGIGLAMRPRTWRYDPGITIDHDVLNTKGNLIARAGQHINPLDFVTVRQSLVFIDGDSPEQLAWATARYSELNAKIIMVRGAPLEAMTRYRRRFYFDQGGFLVGRFAIHAVPAVVEQDGQVMRVSEIPVGIGRR